MAARELRASGRRLTLFLASVTVGVAAIVAVGGFKANVLAGLRDQGRLLLGADLELESRFPFPEEVRAVLDSAVTAGADLAEVTSLPTMVAGDASGRSALLTMRAIDPSYPFYGAVQTEPADGWSRLDSAGAALADPAALTRLDAGLGDTLVIGDLRVVLRGRVTQIPGDPGIRSAVNPRIYLPADDLARTGLVRTGSLVMYRAFLRFSERREVFRFVRRHRTLFARNAISWDTAAERERDLARAFDSLGRFLGLVGLGALLLGGVGVASAMHLYVRQHRTSAAVLRCLGASGWTLVRIYVLQAAVLALIGSLLGAALGIGLQAAIPRALADILPLDFTFVFAPWAVGTGILAGVWTATLFAWRAIVPIRRVPALGAIRQAAIGTEAERRGARGRGNWVERGTLAVIAATVVGLCVWQAGEVMVGLAFAMAAGVTLLLLSATARLLIRVARRVARLRTPFAVRQGVANLFRPQNQTQAAIVALGFGVFLIATIAVVETNVRERFSLSSGSRGPNVALFDVQFDQAPIVTELLSAGGHPTLDVIPIIPARLHAVAGEPVADLLAEIERRRSRRGRGDPLDDDGPGADTAGEDSTGGQGIGGQTVGGDATGGDTTIDEPGAGDTFDVDQTEPADSTRRPPASWALRREYRNSVRDTLVEGERVVAGEWWTPRERSEGARGTEPVTDPWPASLRVSLETEVARALRVGVGDTITWDFQGRTVDSEIASLREVDWARLAPNFLALFEPGSADALSSTRLILTRIDDVDQRAAFQDEVARRFPGALVLDLTAIRSAIGRILDRAAIATRFMGGFTLVAGLLILAATVVASRGLRLRENALLRALGAESGVLRGILLTEFLALGALAGLTGVLLASLSGWALTRWVFEIPFHLPVLGLIGLWAGATLLTLVLGALGSRAVLRPRALVALRRAEAAG
jgi:putative ABC transport system permease protein